MQQYRESQVLLGWGQRRTEGFGLCSCRSERSMGLSNIVDVGPNEAKQTNNTRLTRCRRKGGEEPLTGEGLARQEGPTKLRNCSGCYYRRFGFYTGSKKENREHLS
jgi:hypothetical protein